MKLFWCYLLSFLIFTGSAQCCDRVDLDKISSNMYEALDLAKTYGEKGIKMHVLTIGCIMLIADDALKLYRTDNEVRRKVLTSDAGMRVSITTVFQQGVADVCLNKSDHLKSTLAESDRRKIISMYKNAIDKSYECLFDTLREKADK